MTDSKPTAKRGRPRKRDSDVDTEQRILEQAEELFAAHGFYGVTLREVARVAGVNSALLVYYFDTKRGLFEAVFKRRADLLNAVRLEAFDILEREAGANVTVEACVEAFVVPVFTWSIRGGPGWKHYFSLVAQVNNTAMWGGETMGRHFDPVIQRLIALLRKAIPDARDVDLYWGYHMLTGALTLSLSETGRIDRLSGGLCRSGDLEALLQPFVSYAAAGLRAAAATDRPTVAIPDECHPPVISPTLRKRARQ